MNLFHALRSLLPLEINPPRHLSRQVLAALGYYRLRTRLASKGAVIRDADLYRPLFVPWEGQPEFRQLYQSVSDHSLVDPDRCWILLHLMQHTLALPGHFAEFGVFRGGTALLAAKVLQAAGDNRELHLFDSFGGMPVTAQGEAFTEGDFGQTSKAAVRALIAPVKARVQFHEGYIPETFRDADIQQLAFAHVDVDLYQSVLDCVEFVYPRLTPGGIMLFDDYGFPSCARAREATDLAFSRLREKPIYLPTGQAFVIKLP